MYHAVLHHLKSPHTVGNRTPECGVSFPMVWGNFRAYGLPLRSGALRMRKSYSCNYQKFQIKSQIIGFCKHQKQVSLHKISYGSG